MWIPSTTEKLYYSNVSSPKTPQWDTPIFILSTNNGFIGHKKERIKRRYEHNDNKILLRHHDWNGSRPFEEQFIKTFFTLKYKI